MDPSKRYAKEGETDIKRGKGFPLPLEALSNAEKVNGYNSKVYEEKQLKSGWVNREHTIDRLNIAKAANKLIRENLKRSIAIYKTGNA